MHHIILLMSLDNKLETYFELKDEKPHTWGTQRINSNILDQLQLTKNISIAMKVK